MSDMLVPPWPKYDPDGDVRILTVQIRGGAVATFNGVPMVEVQPVWWRRVFNALTPWRVRTRVFRV